MIGEVLEIATGLQERGDSELLGMMCEIAEDSWLKRLRPGVTREEAEPCFSMAAAWSALDMMECGSEISSFTVGDFSLTGGGTYGEKAEKIMRPYVKRGDFAFCSVES